MYLTVFLHHWWCYIRPEKKRVSVLNANFIWSLRELQYNDPLITELSHCVKSYLCVLSTVYSSAYPRLHISEYTMIADNSIDKYNVHCTQYKEVEELWRRDRNLRVSPSYHGSLISMYFPINQFILVLLCFSTVVMSLIMITTEMISTIGMCACIFVHPT